MRATDLLVLPADVLIVPVDALEPELRARLALGSPGDHLVSRRKARGRSVVVESEAARLLERFRTPTTVADAVVEYCRGGGGGGGGGGGAIDPLGVLESVVPLVIRLRRLRMLVDAGSGEAGTVLPSFAPGDRVGRYCVRTCAHLLDDVEVYMASDGTGAAVALKVLRPLAGVKTRRALEREAAVLRRLGGRLAAPLKDEGCVGGRAFIVTAWSHGADVLTAAARLDAVAGSPDAAAVGRAGLCVRVLRAYAALHAAGILHGDVHPNNVRVEEDGSVTLLDFGLACGIAPDDTLAPLGRAGVAEYMEPEYCRALARREALPRATAPGEQYALAVLCYRLICGAHHLHFSLEREEWIRQVIHEPPRTFRDQGLSPWPAVERALLKGLNKEPDGRFTSVAEFADRLEAASGLAGQARQAGAAVGAMCGASAEPPAEARDLLESVLQRFALAGDRLRTDFISAPFCSVNYGASGVAYFFYRQACRRCDPAALACADLWASWSRARSIEPGAFHSEDIRITPETVSPASLYHGHAGVQCVQALVSAAMGDLHTADLATRAFVAAAGQRGDVIDLATGLCGLLIGCAALTAALPDQPPIDVRAVHRVGDCLLGRVWDRVGERACGDPATAPWLGIAHGWAGILYAALRWTLAGHPPPPGLADRLLELAALGRWDGASVAWPLRHGASAYDRAARTGWCHGSAGYIQLWALAYRVLGDPRFRRLAEGAARHVWLSQGETAPVNGSLCCGYTGQGFGLLSLYRLGGDDVWLGRTATLAGLAAASAHRTERRGSLYKGDVGVALLTAELERPDAACMPLFEPEGGAT